MKSKGITIWEQHVEKIVLAVAFLVFAAFTAMQFVGNPNAVKIGNETVPPSQVDDLLEAKAEAISNSLTATAPSPLELPSVEPVADQIRAELNKSLFPVETLAWTGYDNTPDLGEGVGAGEEKAYAVPMVLAPNPIRPRQYSDALTQEFVSSLDAEVLEVNLVFAAIVQDGEPYDLPSVTVYGELAWAEILKQFAKQGDADTLSIPSMWYGGADPHIVDVVIERGEVVGDDVTNIITLPPLPGQYSFRSAGFLGSEKPLTTTDRNYMLNELRKPEVQREIIQPEFFTTRRNTWQPLMVGELEQVEEIDAALNEEQAAIARMDRLLNSRKAERDRIFARLEELGGRLEPSDDKTPGGGSTTDSGGGGSVGPGTGGGMTSAQDGGGAATANERTRKQRIGLTRKLDQLEAVIARLETEREQLAGAMHVEEVVDDGPRDTIMVWGHDINVEPGKVYQYRMTIKMFNPFFGRKLNLIKDQQHLAESIALASDPSDWSDPLRIDPPVRFFATSATAAGQGAVASMQSSFGQASFEVFRFYDGLTWSSTFSVQPGDRIGGVRDVTLRGPDGNKSFSIDFSTDLIVLDIIKNHDAADRSPLDRGEAPAYVVLMDAKTGEVIEARNPARDRLSTDLDELKSDVDLSEAAALES
jgi:hypothetical protein